LFLNAANSQPKPQGGIAFVYKALLIFFGSHPNDEWLSSPSNAQDHLSARTYANGRPYTGGGQVNLDVIQPSPCE
jgi:hypothetical protein